MRRFFQWVLVICFASIPCLFGEEQKLKFNRDIRPLVPANGLRSHLPEENIFAVYGIKESWEAALTWSKAPKIQEAEKLGTFSIPRSKQFGNYGIETNELKQFVQSGNSKLLIIRETFETRGSGMIHAFANNNHPRFAPPVLEFY